jgi:hypothetical protein
MQNVVLLTVFMLGVAMLSVVILSVIMLSVMLKCHNVEYDLINFVPQLSAVICN